MKKILIIGSGGREHALAWKCAQSSDVSNIFVAQGNAGTSLENKVENINIDVMDFNNLIQVAKDSNIDLTIIGPEAPLAHGIVDKFQNNGLACFGPSKACAQLEASKSYAKTFMQKYHIPTADYQVFTDKSEAVSYLQNQSYPIVLKADGLAAGKGVIIANNFKEAEDALVQLDISSNKLIVIEEFLQGKEASFMAICSGTDYKVLATSQDYKRIGENDSGANTGGMGAISPSSIIDDNLSQTIEELVIQPVLKGMQEQGTPYYGFLYAGLMIDESNNFKVLEFNCRLGDPETQVIMMRMQSDLVEYCQAAINKSLNNLPEIQWDPRIAIDVVMAAGGYPFEYHKGDEITGLDQISGPSIKIFHAGTQINNNKILTNGGRVLAVTALADTLYKARTCVYNNIEKINFHKKYFRKDIGL